MGGASAPMLFAQIAVLSSSQAIGSKSVGAQAPPTKAPKSVVLKLLPHKHDARPTAHSDTMAACLP
ncbi:DUF6053 domain-containing protein [Lysobacter capsici]|uniref:DUF6053 domain-containing protein n=1 Tax=Lysobacter capsici TaxID=435897 RepID=UPI003D2F8AF6